MESMMETGRRGCVDLDYLCVTGGEIYVYMLHGHRQQGHRHVVYGDGPAYRLLCDYSWLMTWMTTHRERATRKQRLGNGCAINRELFLSAPNLICHIVYLITHSCPLTYGYCPMNS